MTKQATPPPAGDRPGPSAPPPPPAWRHWLWPIALLITLVLWLVLPTLHVNQVDLTYTQFLSHVTSHQVKTITLGSNGSATGTLTNGKTYTTVIPSQAGQQFLNELQTNNVEVTATAAGPSFGSEVLSWLILLVPFLLIGWLWVRLSRGAGGQLQGVLGAGRSRAKVFDAERPQTRFNDVAGYEGAKAEIAEVVDFLRHPDRYRRAGATPPRGVLMVGPPGTGKTLLARAVAGEAEVPFFSVAGSSFVELFVGVGAARVRDLFSEARKRAPAIIFIDELDAIGQRRAGSGAVVSNDEREQTLNQLLSEMDGFDPTMGIVVLAATNRPEVLDPALLRPGRFDRRVAVQPPDTAGRRKILEVHTRSVPLAADVDLDRLAATTPGMVGADLANVVNEAALTAARRGHDEVTMGDLHDALEKLVLVGTERRILLSPEERRRTAYHEAGHAIVGMLTPGADPVRKVSIIPRGIALGVTLSAPEADRFSYDRSYLLGKINVALGGRVAEELLFDDITTGAQNDIKQATELARSMVGLWGMSDVIGPVTVITEDGQLPLPGASDISPVTQRLVDEEVRHLIEDAHEQVTQLMSANRDKLEGLAEALLGHETLEQDEAYAAAGIEAPRERVAHGSPDQAADRAQRLI